MLSKLSIKNDNEVYRCSRCGFCRATCPVFDVKKVESWNARGRMLLIKALNNGEIKPSKQLLERIYSCSLCEACEIDCPSQIKVTDVISEIRQILYKSKIGPLPEQKPIIKSISTYGNIFEQKPQNTIFRMKKDVDAVVYVGCTASHSYYNMVDSLLKVLESAGYRVDLIPNETCCGSFLEMLGATKEFEIQKEKNLDIFEKLPVNNIITLCPMCYTSLKKNAKGFNILHSTEIISDLIDREKLIQKRKLNMKVSYHDPCHLGRHSKIFDEPRVILDAVNGVRFIELEKNKNESICCGGPIRIPFMDIRTRMCEAILQETEQVDAEILSTSCPTCLHNLYATSLDIPIADITQLLAYTMGLKNQYSQ